MRRLILLLTLTLPSHAAILFSTGFETGAFTATSAVAGCQTAVISGATPVSGSYIFRAAVTTSSSLGCALRTSGGSNGRFNGSFNSATIAVTLRLRITTLPAANSEEFLHTSGNSGGAAISLRLDSSGHILVYDSTPTLVATGSSTLSADGSTWYRIQVVAGSNSATAAYTVYLNGSSELSGTYNCTATDIDNVTIGKPNNRNSQTISWDYDDAIVESTSFSTGVENMVHTLLSPNGAGTYSDWTGAYTTVDEVPPSTADYAVSSGSSQNVTYAVADLPSGATPYGVAGIRHVTEDSAGTSAFSNLFRSGGTDYTVSCGDVGADPYRGAYYATNPNGGGAWSESAVNGVEIGGQTNTTSVNVRLNFTALEVLYIAASPSSAARRRIIN